MKNLIVFLPIAIFFSTIKLYALELPPKIFIDEGACPFECCTYREWTVNKDSKIYSEVNGSKVIGTAIAGTKVLGVTGEAHTIPLKIKERKNGKYIYLHTV